MDNGTFNEILESELERARNTLAGKAEEYASDKDRLHNFRNAAQMQETDLAGALGGMMIKHTISVYDMINHGNTTDYTLEQWKEKIGDHLNYLLLLMAIIHEDRSQLTRQPGLADPADLEALRERLKGGPTETSPTPSSALPYQDVYPADRTATITNPTNPAKVQEAIAAAEVELAEYNNKRTEAGKSTFSRQSNTFTLLLGKHYNRIMGIAVAPEATIGDIQYARPIGDNNIENDAQAANEYQKAWAAYEAFQEKRLEENKSFVTFADFRKHIYKAEKAGN
jgi:hypothetical protein